MLVIMEISKAESKAYSVMVMTFWREKMYIKYEINIKYK